MTFRITGSLFFLAIAASAFGIYTVPALVLGVIALIAGIALATGK